MVANLPIFLINIVYYVSGLKKFILSAAQAAQPPERSEGNGSGHAGEWENIAYRGVSKKKSDRKWLRTGPRWPPTCDVRIKNDIVRS